MDSLKIALLSLGQEVKKAGERYRLLEAKLASLEIKHQQAEVEKVQLNDEVIALRNEIKSLKLAQSLTGAIDQGSREIKNQINTYIREIDECIKLLKSDIS